MTRRGAHAGVLAAALLIWCVQPLAASNRYDPRLRFRTIATTHFDVHFHQGEEALARRLARIAEEVADRLERDLGRPAGRVHVILVDQTDLSNGWATPVPFNLIEIAAAAPSGESQIGNSDDWLRLVFSHEYTHVVHLEKTRGWIGGLRRVFGRSPILFPNLALPLWQIEGIATYDESVLTGQGRVEAPDFRLLIDRAAAARRFEPLDRASGGLVAWPDGSAQYAYGAFFHQYLADRYGADSIARLSDETARRLPYFGSRAFRKVYGRSLGALWNDFEADTRARLRRDDRNVSTRLTRHGFSVASPRFGRTGTLYYSTINPHGFPALMALRPGESASRQIATQFLGRRIAPVERAIVFDQVEAVHNVGLLSDLYVVPENGGRARRLTAGARAADADVSPDGRTIVCTVQSADRRALATLAVPPAGHVGTPVALISEPDTDFASPRWSPDGRSIVAERRRVEGPSELVVIDVGSRGVRTIVSSSRARNVTPVWRADGRSILFASDRDDEPFRIHAVDVASGRIQRLNGTGESAESPAFSPDGRTLVFVGYTSEGYDLFSLSLTGASWTELSDSTDAPAPPSPQTATASGPADIETYRPLPTLLPRYWMPIVESDSGELAGGAETSGFDALGRHGYAASVAWSTSRSRPDWLIDYAYDRWWPTFFAGVSDDTDPWRSGDVRTRELNVGALFPVRRVRWNATLLAAFSGSSEDFNCPACDPAIDAVANRRALRLGSRFTNARAYGYSISRETGATVTMTTELSRQAWGADGNGGAMTIDVRGYHRAFPRHGVVTARVATAAAWGDRSVRRQFSAAGPGPQSDGFDFGRNAIGLLRGIDADDLAGRRSLVGNLDFRFPLAVVERGAGTLPFFLRTAHAAIFADAGHAWNGTFRREDVKTSIGAELSLDTVIGYSMPLTFTAGVAWREDPATSRRGVVTFGRIGRAF